MIYVGLAIVAYGGFARFFAHPALTALTVLTIVIGLLAGFVPALADRYGLWVIDGEIIRWIGVGLYVAGCAFRAPAIGVVLVASILFPVIARIRAEERLLQQQFGAEYDAYRAHTWRLVPGVY